MIAFALERSGFTVTSGISATAGERKVDMAIRTIIRMTMNQITGDGLDIVTVLIYACRAGTT